jgi:integrase
VGRKKIPGLANRKGMWRIAKIIRGRGICESTGTGNLEEAEKYLARRIEQIRQAEVYGVRPKRIWGQAATKYFDEATKATLPEDARQLRLLVPYIGDLPLEAVHMGTLQQFVDQCKHQGVRKKDGRVYHASKRTKNCALQTGGHILNLAASKWLDGKGQTWLLHAPKIKLHMEDDKKEPFPLSWDEQERLFAELPQYLRLAALFAVNTGCRDQEALPLWIYKLTGTSRM